MATQKFLYIPTPYCDGLGTVTIGLRLCSPRHFETDTQIHQLCHAHGLATDDDAASLVSKLEFLEIEDCTVEYKQYLCQALKIPSDPVSSDNAIRRAILVFTTAVLRQLLSMDEHASVMVVETLWPSTLVDADIQLDFVQSLNAHEVTAMLKELRRRRDVAKDAAGALQSRVAQFDRQLDQLQSMAASALVRSGLPFRNSFSAQIDNAGEDTDMAPEPGMSGKEEGDALHRRDQAKKAHKIAELNKATQKDKSRVASLREEPAQLAEARAESDHTAANSLEEAAKLAKASAEKSLTAASLLEEAAKHARTSAQSKYTAVRDRKEETEWRRKADMAETERFSIERHLRQAQETSAAHKSTQTANMKGVRHTEISGETPDILIEQGQPESQSTGGGDGGAERRMRTSRATNTRTEDQEAALRRSIRRTQTPDRYGYDDTY